jgi:hypothetical protein
MGIQVEFNPDLALRKYDEFERGNRQEEECVPERLEKNKEYDFLKKGLRNYWLEGEIALLETEGDGKLSRPIASITILESAHFLLDKEPYTKGRYLVKEVFDINNPEVKFEWMKRIN